MSDTVHNAMLNLGKLDHVAARLPGLPLPARHALDQATHRAHMDSVPSF